MLEPPTKLIRDCMDAVLKDKYYWLVIWSPPRWGKTLVAGWILYYLYDGDWDKVLQATVFDLDGVMHRIENGLPCRQWTLNKMHNRVPGLNWDDFGGHSNKAVTQHDESFDIFKGGFDVLGTQISILICTMLDPAEATFQLANKYTHEIQITSPAEPGKLGTYKYDRIDWQQDFRANRIRPKKTWIETQTFDFWPEKIYREYDRMRCSLTPEIFQRIRDKRRETETERLVKLLQPSDIAVLELLINRGPCDKRYIPNQLDESDAFDDSSIIRLRSRNLIVPFRGYHRYDITDLGVAALQLLKKKAEEAKAQLPNTTVRT